MALRHTAGYHEIAGVGTWWADGSLLRPMTLMCWGMVDNLSAGRGVMSYGRQADNNTVGITVSSGGIYRITSRDAGGTARSTDFTAASAISTSTWYHFAISVWGGSATQLRVIAWLNGIRLTATTVTWTGGIATPNPVTFYACQNGDGTMNQGRIARARVFEGVLNDNDVRRNLRLALCPDYLRRRCIVDAPFDGLRTADPLANYGKAGGRMVGASSPAWTIEADPPDTAQRRHPQGVV